MWVIQIVIRVTDSIVLLSRCQVVESIHAKLFKNGDFNGSSKIRDITFEEERQTVAVSIMLNRTVMYLLKEILLSMSLVMFYDPVVNQPIEANVPF